jgi:hypothetical protein
MFDGSLIKATVLEFQDDINEMREALKSNKCEQLKQLCIFYKGLQFSITLELFKQVIEKFIYTLRSL